MQRRDFLALLTSAMAITAVGCRRPEQKIVSQPYPVEYMKQGEPNFYASVYQQANSAYGILIKTIDGRPIKIDGNEVHPVNKNTTSARIQAELYRLYDPERFWQPKINNKSATLSNAVESSLSMITEAIGKNKEIIVFYDEHCSPTFQKLIDYFNKKIPDFKFVCLSTFNQLKKKSFCNKLLFDIDSAFIPQISKASFILSIADDFLASDKFSLFYANEFAKIKDCKTRKFAKLMTIESGLSLTGANSDQRIVLKPNQFEPFLANVLKIILIKIDNERFNEILTFLNKYPEINNDLAKTIADEILVKKENACVLANENLSLTTHLYAMLINYIVGNIGEGKIFDLNFKEPFSNYVDFAEFKDYLNPENVACLLLADCNPLHNPIAEIRRFYNSIDSRKIIAFSYYPNQYPKDIAIQIPTTHFLESWSDAIAFNGSYTVQQPVIYPLNKESTSFQDFLLTIAKRLSPSDFAQFNTYYDYLRNSLNTLIQNDEQWDEALKNGVLLSPQNVSCQVELKLQKALDILENETNISNINDDNLILNIKPSHIFQNINDVRNPILKELPNSLTSLSWDNALLISPHTAKKLNVKDGDIIKINKENAVFRLPVLIQKGICDGVISYDFDFSDEQVFSLMNNENGYNLFGNNFFVDVKAENSGEKVELALISKRKISTKQDIIKVISLDDFNRTLSSNRMQNEEDKSLYKYLGHFWGMSIDTSKCIGCSSCIIACQIENNIPVVGRDQVIKNRAMHWIRLERYVYSDDQSSVFIPIMCQHCEKAPCETVCPVNATTHSPEGINEMTYNRCIGSRFCMINCPYNVRRFNFSDYHSNEKKSLENIHNPDVTIRMRGIVEKCTFCIQRIIKAKYKARDEGRNRLEDGEIKTACQIACPTGAIVFGDLNNPDSEIIKNKELSHSYKLLDELGTNPSVNYLSKIKLNQ